MHAGARSFAEVSVIAAIGLVAEAAWSLPGQPTPAETVFREGREAAQRGDMATACAKFGESVQLARAPGPLMNLADCEEKAGRLVGAAKLWKEAIEKLEPGDKRLPFATERAAALDKKLPRLTVRVTPETSDAQIEINGARVPPSEARAPQPVDPGVLHKVVVRAGARTERAEITMGEGERREVIVALGLDNAAAGRPPAPAEGSGSGMRTAGFITAGVGVAGLAVFGVTAALIEGRRSTVRETCNEAKECSAEGLEAVESGQALIPINAVGFAVGIVGLGAGVTLILLSPSGPRPGPAAAVRVSGAPGRVVATLGGTF
jgi:hypothetical protein